MQYIVLGTEIKINIHAEPIDGLSMNDYDFFCDFFSFPNKKVRIHKSEMIVVDNDNYIASMDSTNIGVGNIKVRMTASVPDTNFSDGIRTEIAEYTTDIVILR